MYEKLKRDGDYLLVFRHDSSGGEFFASDEEARFTGQSSTDDKFSVLRDINRFRRKDGKFQFKLHYPQLDITNIWKQSNNFASDNESQFLRNGIFAGGDHVEEFNNNITDYSVVEMLNPGSSNYVLKHDGSTKQVSYTMDVPQSRLQPNTTYTLSVWVGCENDADQDLGLFHCKWYDSSGTQHSIGDAAGSVYQSAGNEQTINGINWKRRFITFTTSSTLNNGNFIWHLGYTQRTSTGNSRYITNAQVLNSPLILNYAGDYKADDGGTRGYEAVDVEVTSNNWNGIEFTGSGNTFADGAVDSTSWWYSIGTKTPFSGFIPGPSQSTTMVELWVYDPISVRVSDMSLDVCHFNEAGAIENEIVVQAGSSFTNAALLINDSTVFGTVSPDNIPNINGSMYLVILNSSMSVVHNTLYDVSNTTQRNNFISALNSVQSNQVFIISSNGIVNSHTDLDTAMINKNSREWRGVDLYDEHDYAYCGIGRGDIGFLSERNIFNYEPDLYDANIHISFTDINDLCNTGYSNALIEVIDNSGSLTIPAFSFADWVAGEYIIYSVQARKSLNDSQRYANLRFFNSNNNDLSSDTLVEIQSAGLYENITIHTQIPTNTTKISFDGDADIKMVTVHKAGRRKPRTDMVRMTDCGISGYQLVESPIPASVYDNNSFARFARSDTNLLSTLPIGQDESTSVEWGKFNLTSNNEKCYFNITNDLEKLTSQVTIDPSRTYYCGVWVYQQAKSSGLTGLGVTTYNNSGSQVSVKLAGTNTTSTDFYFQDPTVSSNNEDIRGQWVLLDGWMLPHNWSLDDCNDFVDDYKHFFGVISTSDALNDLNNGVGVLNGGTSGNTMLQLNSSSTKATLRLLDEGNGSNASTSLWAFPFIVDVLSAGWNETDVYTPNLNLI